VQRAVSRKTEIFKQSTLRKTCVGKSLVQFKDTRSASSKDVDLEYRIPAILRQQQCWKFASVRKNVGTSWFRKLGCQMQHLPNVETSAALLQSEIRGR
jgi:endonuclease I